MDMDMDKKRKKEKERERAHVHKLKQFCFCFSISDVEQTVEFWLEVRHFRVLCNHGDIDLGKNIDRILTKKKVGF